MIKKILLFSFIMLFFAIPSAYAQFQIKLKMFNNLLEPVDPDLKAKYNKNKTLDYDLEKTIIELRETVQNHYADKNKKIDLASFLLKKAYLSLNFPYDQIESLFVEAAELVPNDPYIESFWGDVLLHKRDYENCIIHYENALSQKPEDSDYLKKCGIAYYSSLRYEKSIEYFDTILEKDPKDFESLYLAASAKFELHEYDGTIEYGEKALEICSDPNTRKNLEELIRKAKEAAASTSGSVSEENQKFVITFAGNSREDLGDFAFDSLDDIYYDVTSLLNCDPDVKVNVVFFLTDEYYKDNKDWSAASALGLQVRVPLVTGYKSEEYVKGVLSHEFTHTIINLKTHNRAPIWVHEGLAQYQQFRTEYGDENTLRPDYVSIYENDFKENDLFIPLDSIQAFMSSSDRRDICRAYIASWLAMRCMADLYTESSFDTLLTSLGKGNNIRQAVEDATGQDYKAFQDEMKQWIKNQ